MRELIDIRPYIDNIRVDRSDIAVYKKLLHKFEVNKKLYMKYKQRYLTDKTETELSEDQYKKIFMIFLELSIKEKDIRFYNTALKIADKCQINIPKINISNFL